MTKKFICFFLIFSLRAAVVEDYYRLMFSSAPLERKLEGLFEILKERGDFYHAYSSSAGIMAYGGLGFSTPFSPGSFQHKFLLFLYKRDLSRSVQDLLPRIKNPPFNPFILKDLFEAGWEGKGNVDPRTSAYLKSLSRGFPSLSEAEWFYTRFSRHRQREVSLFFVFWYLNSLLIKRRAASALPMIESWQKKSPFKYPFWFLLHYYYVIVKKPHQRLLYILKATRETEKLYLLDLHNLYKRMLATSYGKLGQFNKALEKFNETLKFYRTFGKRKAVVDVLISRAYLFYENYLYEAAREDLIKALDILKKYPSYKRAYVYSLLALVMVKLNRVDEAERYAKLGQNEAKKYRFSTALYSSRLALARAYLGKGRVGEALSIGKEMEAVGRKKGDRELLFSSLELERLCYERMGDYSKAAAKTREALSYAPTPRDKLKIYLELYKTLSSLGRRGLIPWVIYSLRAYPYIVKARRLASSMRLEDFPTREVRYEFLKNTMEIYTLFGKASMNVAGIMAGLFLLLVLSVGGGFFLLHRMKQDVLGSYQIVKELGRGGMGVVYLARSIKTGNKVALKVMDGIKASPQELRNFIEEAEILKKLSHPNIVRFLDSGQEGTTLYIAMEYIRGSSLSAIASSTPPPFALADVQEVALGTGLALSYLHRHNVVHRDIKPSNILIEGRFEDLEGVKSEDVKLTDFSIARTLKAFQESTANIVGTPHFISPEALKSGIITPASDVYAFGVLLFWMLTGKYPFHHSDFSIMISWILTVPPPSLSRFVEVPPCWEEIVGTCLAKDPSERFPSGKELLEALLRCGSVD